MNVDKNGNPVSVGTWGLHAGNSARVVRTMIDPVADDKATQEALMAGAYFVERGAYGEALTDPSDFTSVDRADVVIAQDGQEVREGDKIEYAGGIAGTVKTLYPVGKFGGPFCLSIKEKSGGAPDGHLGVGWGQVEKVTKRANGSKPGKYRYLPGSTYVENLKVYDFVEFKSDSDTVLTGFIRQVEKNGGYDFETWIVDGGITAKPGNRYWVKKKRVSQVWSHASGPWPTPVGFIAHGERAITTVSDEEIEFVMEKATFDAAHEHKGLILVASEATKVDSGDSSTYRKFWARTVKEIKTGALVFISDDNGENDELRVGDTIVFTGDGGEDFEGVVEIIASKALDEDYDGVANVSTDNVGTYAFKNDNIALVIRDGRILYDRDKDTASSNNTNNVSDSGDSQHMANEATGKDATALKTNTLAQAAHSKQAGKVDVVNTGTQIILPSSGPASTMRGAIKELERRAEQEEMDVNVMETIAGYPLDAAHAFIRALESIFGWVNSLPHPGFFGPTPPTMIGVNIDADGHTVQIPWGMIGIPGVTGKLATGIQMIDNWPTFCIQGTIKQKDKKVVNEIATYARNYLKENSLYRGKAVRVRFPSAGAAWSPLDHQPQFINTAVVRPEELIFNRQVEKRISVNVWTPIVSNAAVRAAKVPLKRGVLLHGRYGVGKTLLATVTAQLAVKAGITFIDLMDSKQLPDAIKFARTFGGMVVIFAEDIDRCDDNGTRSNAFNEILNTVDGLTSKSDEVLVVYTTNHIERISKAMLRPGRMDVIIEIPEPDADAAERLIRLYARHMLDRDENIHAVSEDIAAQKMIPAAIREIVEQSKLAAIERGDMHHITAEDLAVTVENIKAHNELLREPVVDDRSEFERLGDAVGTRIANVVEKVLHAAESSTIDSDGDGNTTAMLDAVAEAVQEGTSRRNKAA